MVAAGAFRNFVRRRLVRPRVVSGILGGGIVMAVVQSVLDMLGLGPARLAVEGQEDQPPGIETGQQSGEDADREGEPADRGAAGEGALDDRVLGEEAGEAEAR